jgi:hypothetical protein
MIMDHKLNGWRYHGIIPTDQAPTMKQLTTLSCIAILGFASIPSLQAQELRFGGGYAGSNVRQAGDERWEGRAGYQLGVDMIIGQRFFVKPGIHLMVRNLRYTIVGTGADGLPAATESNYRYNSRALRIPLLAGVRLLAPSDLSEFNIYALGGPTALIGLSADLDDNSLEVTTRGTQWYLGFGAGMEYRFLFLEGGYDVAMSNVFQGEGLSTNPRVNNTYVTVGLRFVLKQ